MPLPPVQFVLTVTKRKLKAHLITTMVAAEMISELS